MDFDTVCGAISFLAQVAADFRRALPPAKRRRLPIPDLGRDSMRGDELPSELREATAKFVVWSEQQLEAEQSRNAITAPLYHYTNGHGLKGILESETIWFTDYRHLNDPSELTHGMRTAHDVMRNIAADADGRVRLFLGITADLFSHANLSNTLEFFIASFSREPDDLGQWRAYADNGRGYALGLSPQVFGVVEKPVREPNENVLVGPVLYQTGEVCARHRQAIEKAASIFLQAADANVELMRDKSVGVPFMREMAKELLASSLIWNCLTSKHPAYAHEREVRMIILGLRSKLLPYVTTRVRGSEIVPYIVHQMPLRQPHHIFEIVVGPAAPADAERCVETMLRSLGADPRISIRRSEIPYRAT